MSAEAPSTGHTLRTRWISHLRDRVSAMAWSPDAGTLLAGSLAGDAALLDAADGCPLSVRGGAGGVLSVGWSSDGGLLAVGGQDGDLSVSALDPDEDRWSVDLGGWVSAVAWAPDRRVVAAAAGVDMRVLDGGGALVAEYPLLAGHVNDLSWSPTGCIDVALRGAVLRYEPPLPEPVDAEPTVGTVVSLVPSPDGRVLAGGKLNGSVVLIGEWEGPGLLLTGYMGGIRRLSWRADSTRLAVGAHGETSVWPIDGGKPTGDPVEVLRFEPAPGGLAFHPYRDLLATGGADGTVALWLPDESQRPVATIPVGAEVSALDWQPTGESMAVGTADGRVVLVELGLHG